jgi:hypothetical protein
VECSIVGIIDRVEALETGLPAMDQDKLPNDTREDDHIEEEEVEQVEKDQDKLPDDPFNPPRPPPRWQHCDG